MRPAGHSADGPARRSAAARLSQDRRTWCRGRRTTMSSGHTPRFSGSARGVRMPCRGCTAQRPYQSPEGEKRGRSDRARRSPNGAPSRPRKRVSPDPSANNPNRIGRASWPETFSARVGSDISKSFHRGKADRPKSGRSPVSLQIRSPLGRSRGGAKGRAERAATTLACRLPPSGRDRPWHHRTFRDGTPQRSKRRRGGASEPERWRNL